MAFFHVLLTFFDAPQEARCVLMDLSEHDLKKQFLQPYSRGTTMLAGSEVVDTMNIHSTTIIKTDRTNEEEREDIQESSRKHLDEMNRQGGLFFLGSPHGYAPEDIVEAGVDVTKTYINTPPGHGRTSVLSAVLTHPWVSAIATGLVVAGLVKALGWV